LITVTGFAQKVEKLDLQERTRRSGERLTPACRPITLRRMRTRLNGVMVAVLFLGMWGFAGCGDGSEGAVATATSTPLATATPTATVVPLTSAELLQPGPAAVGSRTLTLVDASRSTMPNGTYPGADTRTLVTEIWYPTDPVPGTTSAEIRDASLQQSGVPYPLVIYSHGFISNRLGGTYLARQLASYGYIVASPDFPLTNAQAPGGPNFFDVENQPGDVTFIIDELLAMSGDTQSWLAAGIDANRIGLTGLSLGGMTTYLATFSPTLRDPRIRAAAPQAGPACSFGESFFDDRHIPLLILQGDIDAIVPYRENSVFAYGEAKSPKYFVTLTGGSHTGFADGTEIFDSANNPDDIGCRALSGATGGDNTPAPPSFLGGAAGGIIVGDCPAGCSGPRPTSMKPSLQHQLTILSELPFFQAYLRGDTRAQAYIEQTLAVENPQLTLQFER
jgi:predicted dienelactone hydrolase